MNSTIPKRAATLGVPLATIASACVAQGLTFESLIPVVVVAIFAIVQAGLQHFLLDAIYDYFAAVGKTTQYWVSISVINALMGLGCVQLYILAMR